MKICLRARLLLLTAALLGSGQGFANSDTGVRGWVNRLRGRSNSTAANPQAAPQSAASPTGSGTVPPTDSVASATTTTGETVARQSIPEAERNAEAAYDLFQRMYRDSLTGEGDRIAIADGFASFGGEKAQTQGV